MQVLHFHAEHGNFGDDLNATLWERVLSPKVWDAPDVVLVGIGTILNDDRLNAQTVGDARVFILGSGAGYGRLCTPEILQKAEILAVRGPLTAALVGQPQSAATDGAALLATLPECQPIARTGQASFIPHISSALSGDWEKACQIAQVDYIDPRWAVEKVIAAIRKSKLVITEAMHGAILSDTLRVPWVPVVTSSKILDLKWHDWTRSLDLRYEPHILTPTRTKQALVLMRNRSRAGAKSGQSTLAPTNEALIADFQARYGDTSRALRAPAKSRERPGLDRALSVFDPVVTVSTGRAIAKLKTARPYLSADPVFSARLQQLQDAVGRFEQAVL
jgi:succinoglycan biosynthesis protein ExoV